MLLEEEDHKDVPRHFKFHTIQDRDIFCEKAKHIEGPAKVKEVNLGLERCLNPSDRKSTRLNSSHSGESRMPSSA